MFRNISQHFATSRSNVIGTGKLGDLETKEAENPSVVCFCGGLAKTSFALDHQI